MPQCDTVACQKQRVTLLVGIETGRKDWLGQNGLTVAPSNMFVLCWCVFPEHLLAMRPASIKHFASCDSRLSVVGLCCLIVCCASRDQFCTCCVNRVVACELSVVCCCDICAFESCEFMRMIHVVCEFARLVLVGACGCLWVIVGACGCLWVLVCACV